MFRGICDAPGDDGAVGGCAQLMGAPPPQAIGKVETVLGGPVTVMGASGAVAQDPAKNRVYFEFVDSSGVVRGSTSTAVTTQ